MANALYNDLFRVVSEYIGDERAKTTLVRQLERSQATPDSVTKTDLNEVMNFLIGGTTLYLYPDKAKQAELKAKLQTFA